MGSSSQSWKDHLRVAWKKKPGHEEGRAQRTVLRMQAQRCEAEVKGGQDQRTAEADDSHPCIGSSEAKRHALREDAEDAVRGHAHERQVGDRVPEPERRKGVRFKKKVSKKRRRRRERLTLRPMG